MGDDKNEVEFSNGFISNEKFFDMFMKLDSKVDSISETLNNGLKSEVETNSEELTELQNKVSELEDTVEESANIKQGKKESNAHTREIIAYVVAVSANIGWILVMLDIL